MSRLFVKNLPKYLTEQRLKDHFSQRGEVTDVRIIKNKNTGDSRQFGFVGYRSEKEAKEAIKYFNNSYLDTRKLDVFPAKVAGDAALPTPWSRHSKGSSAYKRQNPEERTKEEEPAAKKQKTGLEESSQKKYFMNLVKSSKGQLWRDDNVTPEALAVSKTTLKDGSRAKVEDSYVRSKKAGGEGIFYEKKRILFEDSDGSGDEEEYQTFPGTVSDGDGDLDGDDAMPEPQPEPELSDMDFLRSKMISKDKLEEDEEEEDIEVELEEEKDTETPNSKELEPKESAAKGENEKENKEIEEKDENQKTQLFGDDEENIGESGRLFVRNLPFTTTEEDMISHFSRYGELAEVHLPVDPETKKGKGFAFVQYMIPVEAVVAFEQLDNSIFQGRLIHVLPGKSLVSHQEKLNLSEDAKSSYKKKKETKTRDIASDTRNWNTIFLRSDTVANAIADTLDVKKSDLFNPEADNMAVRMALAETQIIEQTKKALEEEGVNLDALQYQNASDYKRSNNVILVKNLPFSTVVNDLYDLFTPFGTLGRVILPPTKAIALVEFAESNEAKKAFRGLAYKRFKHVPLYLEWTPELIFNAALEKKEKPSSNKKSDHNIKRDAIVDEEIQTAQTSTLYVKNINFTTSEESLRLFFTKIIGEAPVRSVRIAKSRGKKSQSLGYGFVELADKTAAVNALKKLQGKELDDYKVELKFSKSNAPAKSENKRKVSQKAPEKPTSTKLMIRNLAFETERKDLVQLCKPFGKIKAVRIPSKFDGRSRGFGFVEFFTKQDAKNTLEKLSNAHLYGRHLVIEYASEKQASVDELRKKQLEKAK